MAFQVKCFLVSVVLVLITGPRLSAECVLIPVDRTKRDARVVFEGTVTNVEHLRGRERAATLTVHRVWKGDVPPEITVYFVPSLDGPSFDNAQRRIVFAGPQSQQDRRDVGADAPYREAWVRPCSGSQVVEDETVRQLGRARPPRTH